MQVALAAGLTFELAYLEYPATRGRERRLKNQGGGGRVEGAAGAAAQGAPPGGAAAVLHAGGTR